MKENFDFGKDWSKTKEHLLKFSQEAVRLAKKGEHEFRRITQHSRLQIDSTASGLHREHLYYLIGKEYVKAKYPSRPSEKLNRLIHDLDKVERDLRKLKKEINHKNKSSLPHA